MKKVLFRKGFVLGIIVLFIGAGVIPSTVGIKKEKTTIDDLAIIIKKGFDEVDKRFDGVDKRFDGVDKRFDKVEKRLDNLEKGHEEINLKLGNVAYRFELIDLQKRVQRVEDIVLRRRKT